MTVRVVTDSSCDLPQALADQLGIQIVPLTIRFGSQEFVDRLDLTPAEFWARCADSPVLPETAAPAPGQFELVYRGLAEEGAGGVVVVSLSSRLSGTMQSAQLAANAVYGSLAVDVVDSRSVSTGLGMIAVAAARLAGQGAQIEEVAGLARDLARRTHVWAVLDTLDYLRKGGRIGSTRAMFASVLAIKQIIEVRHGQVQDGGRQRTRSRALAAPGRQGPRRRPARVARRAPRRHLGRRRLRRPAGAARPWPDHGHGRRRGDRDPLRSPGHRRRAPDGPTPHPI